MGLPGWETGCDGSESNFQQPRPRGSDQGDIAVGSRTRMHHPGPHAYPYEGRISTWVHLTYTVILKATKKEKKKDKKLVKAPGLPAERNSYID